MINIHPRIAGLLAALLLVFAFGAMLPEAVLAAGAAPQSSGKLVYNSNDLFRLGPVRTFEGSALKEIAFPLGGIGTGTVSIGGRGQLRDWEIFNRPGKGVDLPFTFFALAFSQNGQKPVVRVLEGRLKPPFTGEDGVHRAQVPGLPRMEKVRFRGEYPFAWVELEDSKLPLQVTLEAFNPFIPLKPDESGIPAVILRFRVRNLGRVPAQVTIAGSLLNPIGFDGNGTIGGIGLDKFGQNVNEVRKASSLNGLFMSSRKVKPDAPAFGTMALASPWKSVTYLSHWVRGDWWDDLQIFWDDFAADGRLKDLDEKSPSPDKRTDIGTLGLVAEIEPFGEVTLPFILSWSFPNFLDDFDIVREQRGKIFKNHYAERFADAWASAEYLQSNLGRLESESRRFHDVFFASTLPPYILDAASSQASIARTMTCFWLEGGQFFAFEGCNDKSGCCPLNCAHVWNYEQSVAFLFPSLERFMREVDFLSNTKDNGEMVFRTSLPLWSGVYWKFRPAADGSLGRIINLYRDWQLSGDLAFLKKVWPKAKKVLEYTWLAWDTDKDGLIEGEQHNTYDIEFYGPNSMIGTFYLGALLAGSRMADAVGDADAAKTYKALFEKGRAKFDQLLWNGEYYVQKYDQVVEKKYQYGDGCLSDQMLGQWLAQVAGLGRFLPEDRLKTTLGSVFKYNFMPDFREFFNGQRTYALNDERGLVLCTWPKGGRPPLPFVYSDEVWTGIEYHVASHLIYEGLVDEGLTVAKAVRDRYDGLKRNPWDEIECGHHYARAMSSWGLILALSGFSYSGPEATMGFAPKVYADDFRTFWSTGSGWGNYSQRTAGGKSQSAEVEIVQGGLSLREFRLALPESVAAKAPASIRAEATGKTVKASFVTDGRTVRVKFDAPVALKAGDKLTLTASY
jgi:non-lysosomal glucosylceramidase